MRLLVQHRSHYGYPRPAVLGPHTVRLRPANHTRARVETYRLLVEQDHEVRWQQDPYGNHVARVTFPAEAPVAALDLLVEMAVDVHPVNPFDFYVDDRCKDLPFEYPQELQQDLRPFLEADEGSRAPGSRLRAFLDELPRRGSTVGVVVELNRRVHERIRYVIREESGIYTPEQTLAAARGSCRDSAVLLVAALRSRGLAARFVSGYLVQLTDEGMIPDAPRGVGRDVVDLHAWAEVFLPGAGWIGLDATSGLLCGEGHIPLACTALPALAAPLEGTSDTAAHEVTFQMTVGRLGHEPRPTMPYEEPIWERLLAAGDRADAALAAQGLVLTMGGEPTFNSREHVEAPEWNGEALGPTKWSQGLRLARELRRVLCPGAALLHRMGKLYPGEALPRWALDLVGRPGAPLWSDVDAPGSTPTDDDARRLAEVLAHRLGSSDTLLPAYEDPWRFLQDEQSLPIDVDPLRADLGDPDARRRLARVLDRGLGRPVGWVLPLTREAGAWRSERWRFRREHLFLLQGDSPIGLRLPLASLAAAPPPPPPQEEPYEPPDPRRTPSDEAQSRVATARAPAVAAPRSSAVRTAVCVEHRAGAVYVFLPPLPACEDFFALVETVDAARREAGVDVVLEGYPPPPSVAGPKTFRLSVTPDPGVLEVNLPPAERSRDHAALVEQVFDAALHAGLHSEKYLVDGRQVGSGGGNHLTLGGPTPLTSPFLRRPDLLASLLTFLQHHPSLSYLFTGLFVGPTSQAPRVDEARHDALYELELALARAHARRDPEPPWLADALFRHLLVDVAGNTHRTELCIDKLFDPGSPHGRQGLIELRAFEMPPHPRMVSAQMVLVRSLVAAFAGSAYQGPLVRWGASLHDRFLLPYYLWTDFEDVLAFLASRALGLPDEGYRPFLELRCPLVGTLHAGDVTLEVRNALEPWNVLGEEATPTGTSRYVDSSMERIEVRATGLLPDRHRVLVNGHLLPLHPTRVAGQYVAGVRFRAWAPPHSLHPHLGVHHPVRLDVLDAWARRSLGACAYHVWHPEGRAFDSPPLTRFEAAARRAQRFTVEGGAPWPVEPRGARPAPDAPLTLDLRRYPIDRFIPPPPEEA